jgi:glutathione synthase/RimK-type ligase-like ATP-grasp enzyme
MTNLIVVDNPDRWALEIPDVPLLSARSYLTDPSWTDRRHVTVFNLCGSYAYQSLGYYVSMLAEARGHRPQPSVGTLQDLKLQALMRIVSDDLQDVMDHALALVHAEEFVLSIYFGRPLVERHRTLALSLFNQFPAPLLRARFERGEDGWNLTSLRPIPAKELPPSHHEFVVQAAADYFKNRPRSRRKRAEPRWELAILHDPQEKLPPSNRGAIERFERAAEKVGFGVELITRDDYGRLAEFDALFIRVTTGVAHYTYRFARRAAAEGLVVIDDPRSIARATNKVYQAELLARHDVPTPRTVIVHENNRAELAGLLGFPIVLKQPDSAFSVGVVKVHDQEGLERELEALLEQSDLVLAQEFVQTDFDWRVGVLDGKPLYACRYFMALHHWQILKHGGESGSFESGKVETLAVETAPRNVVRTAVRAAALMGDGLYGVDLKQAGRHCYVIEINDNPTIDAGYEDKMLRQELYERIMQVMFDRVERRKQGRR